MSQPDINTPKPLSDSKTDNWVARAGGLPHPVQHVAHALIAAGHSEQEAIRIAVGKMHEWAHGEGGVHPDTKAVYQDAEKDWSAKRSATKKEGWGWERELRGYHGRWEKTPGMEAAFKSLRDAGLKVAEPGPESQLSEEGIKHVSEAVLDEIQKHPTIMQHPMNLEKVGFASNPKVRRLLGTPHYGVGAMTSAFPDNHGPWLPGVDGHTELHVNDLTIQPEVIDQAISAGRAGLWYRDGIREVVRHEMGHALDFGSGRESTHELELAGISPRDAAKFSKYAAAAPEEAVGEIIGAMDSPAAQAHLTPDMKAKGTALMRVLDRPIERHLNPYTGPPLPDLHSEGWPRFDMSPESQQRIEAASARNIAANKWVAHASVRKGAGWNVGEEAWRDAWKAELRNNKGEWEFGGMKTDDLKSQASKLDTVIGNPKTYAAQRRQYELLQTAMLQEVNNRDPDRVRDMVVVGGGTGGLTAAIHAAAEGRDIALLEKSDRLGGQARMSSRIENYSGYEEGVTGRGLVKHFARQATRLGADVRTKVGVTGIDYDHGSGIKTLHLDDGSSVRSRAVVLAHGNGIRRLPNIGNERRGVVYGDVMDDRFKREVKGRDAVVVGGANSSGQAAIDLSHTAHHVTILLRHGPLEKEMSKYLIDQINQHPRISVQVGEITKVMEDKNGVHGVALKDGSTLKTAGVAVMAGGGPESKYAGVETTGPKGAVKTAQGSFETSTPGVFAIGTGRDRGLGRVAATVGEGAGVYPKVNAYLSGSQGSDQLQLFKHARAKSNRSTDQSRTRRVPRSRAQEPSPNPRASGGTPGSHRPSGAAGDQARHDQRPAAGNRAALKGLLSRAAKAATFSLARAGQTGWHPAQAAWSGSTHAASKTPAGTYHFTPADNSAASHAAVISTHPSLAPGTRVGVVRASGAAAVRHTGVVVHHHGVTPTGVHNVTVRMSNGRSQRLKLRAIRGTRPIHPSAYVNHQAIQQWWRQSGKGKATSGYGGTGAMGMHAVGTSTSAPRGQGRGSGMSPITPGASGIRKALERHFQKDLETATADDGGAGSGVMTTEDFNHPGEAPTTISQGGSKGRKHNASACPICGAPLTDGKCSKHGNVVEKGIGWEEARHPRGYHGRWIWSGEEKPLHLGGTRTPLVREQLGHFRDTREKYSTRLNGRTTYTPERMEQHRQWIEDLFKQAGAKPQAKGERHMMFVAGGPASGKSSAEKYMPKFPNSVEIDPDNFKAQMSEYQTLAAARDPYASDAVHEEAADLAHQARKEAMRRGYNVVVQGTGNSGKGQFANKISDAHSRGYNVHVFGVSAPTEVAKERAEARAKAIGRAVPEEGLRAMHANVSRNWSDVEKLAPMLNSLFLFDSRVPKGQDPLLMEHLEGPGGSLVADDPKLMQEFRAKAKEHAARPITAPSFD